MRICFIVTYSYHYLPCFIGIPIVPTAWSSGFRWPWATVCNQCENFLCCSAVWGGFIAKSKAARLSSVRSSSAIMSNHFQPVFPVTTLSCTSLIWIVDHPPVIETWLAGKSPSMIFPQKNSIFIWDFWTSSKPLRAMDPPVFHLHQQGQRHFPLPPFLTCADPDDMKADAQRVSVAFPMDS